MVTLGMTGWRAVGRGEWSCKAANDYTTAYALATRRGPDVVHSLLGPGYAGMVVR